MIKILLSKIREFYARRSSESLRMYFIKKGIRIGEGSIFRSPSSAYIDIMRPSLISIGCNVDMNRNFTIMAHDFSHRVFVPLYGEFLSSSGEVKIGNNIYFGTNVTVLKGVTIGNNCIIGAGSVVSRSIPSNSVAAGVPCKVICSIEDYYQKRQYQYVMEAIAYARNIRDVQHREPTIHDFGPEFGIFVDAHNISEYNVDSIKSRLKDQFVHWIENHVAPFNGFEDFLKHTIDQRDENSK